MKKIFHPAESRGNTNFGWLDANYSFSFANFFDPNKVQFGLLRVLNDDVVKGGMGFDTHPHKDMEIVTIPLAGALQHKDSLGHSATIKAGEVQVMSAGTGVKHSEFNAHNGRELNLLQLWIFPENNQVEPRYDQKDFSGELVINKLTTIVSPKDKCMDGSLWIHQQAYLSFGDFEDSKTLEYQLKNEENGVYVFLIEGEVSIDGQALKKRDALGILETKNFKIEFQQKSKVLLIEVPMK